MLANFDREKLINAILYFARNTKHCGRIKLFKLLYFLDFGHYKQIGRSVTGLDYFAWPRGPVPKELNDELDDLPSDLANNIRIKRIPTKHDNHMQLVEPKRSFNPGIFSKRELRLLEDLAKEYKNTLAKDMIEATHLETLPWNQVYKVEGKKQKKIPYKYALRKEEVELINCITKENQEVINNYK